MLFKSFFLFFPFFAEIGYVEPWGKDAGLDANANASSQVVELSAMGKVAEAAILFHHRVLTHISGPRSHFRPTSSQYMLEAIREYGFVKGYIMGCDRLLRENADPWLYYTKVINGMLYKSDEP